MNQNISQQNIHFFLVRANIINFYAEQKEGTQAYTCDNYKREYLNEAIKPWKISREKTRSELVIDSVNNESLVITRTLGYVFRYFFLSI